MLEYVQAVVLSIVPLLGLDILSVINSLTTKRTFGVELELVNMTREEVEKTLVEAGIPSKAEIYTHNVQKGYWKVVTDYSLEVTDCKRHSYAVRYCMDHTAEVVSPILSGISGLIETARVLLALKKAGANANVTCGIHIHVDAPEYWQAWNKVYQLMLSYVGLGLSKEDKALRKYNRYARSVDDAHSVVRHQVELERQVIRVGKDLEEELYRSDELRYYAVNYCSMYKHRTIEFRQLAGTFNLLALLKWIVAVVMLTEKVSDYTGCPICNEDGHGIDYCSECDEMVCLKEHQLKYCTCGKHSCRPCSKRRCCLCGIEHCTIQGANHSKYCSICDTEYCGERCSNSTHCDVCGIDTCDGHFVGTCRDCREDACSTTYHNHGNRCMYCGTRYCNSGCPDCGS